MVFLAVMEFEATLLFPGGIRGHPWDSYHSEWSCSQLCVPLQWSSRSVRSFIEVVLQLKELLFVRYTRAVISLGLLLGFVGPLSLVNICYSFAMELLYYHKVLM